MSHSTIIISRVVVFAPSGTDEAHPEVEATVTYRPRHGAGPKEIAQTVERITRRIDGIADVHPDE